MKQYQKWLPILLILLLAFGLRLYALSEIPPGLTHDEANHGREAIGILQGVWLFVFPLNYGSEPLYSYTAAASMWLFGKTLFALRFVNVLFSVFAIGVSYLWVRRRFDETTALVTAVLLSITFWPLASAREALRAGMLPFFMGTAVYFFWLLLDKSDGQSRRSWGWTVAFGVCVAITLHIYLAARVAWLVFPLFLAYLAWQQRGIFRQSWRFVIAGLLLAGILVTPLFVYLEKNPYALTRLSMLDAPLENLRNGNLLPLWENATAALLAFVWPGFGDQFLAYNIPGRPVFDAVTAVFFVLGLGICLWRWKRPSYAVVLLWFGIGILPSLITGPTANTTRNLAALIPVFVLPAIGFGTVVQWLKPKISTLPRWVLGVGTAVWLLFAGWSSSTDYFITWANNPGVRGAYQVNLVATLDYLANESSTEPVLLSTVYPGPAHDPSINLVLTGEEANKRWADASWALVAPGGQSSRAMIPASTPPHPFFAQWLEPRQTVAMRPDDLDPSFTDYWLDASQLQAWAQEPALANFNNALALHHAQWLNSVTPGGTAELLLIWRVTNPANAGPIVPPAFTTDVVMFTQLLDASGMPFAQRDALDAPSWAWQAGDLVAQIHPIPIPVETTLGSYQAIVGIYDRLSGNRLPVLGEDGEIVGDFTAVSPLEIGN
ncbi:glycosyltransferase family 39 protein [Candidatus Leptofilum sp.]|uniref:glycosyltransferase family 39 protein n=1 Tax=Candidatus Leptofilum sp. TaxID=3241576 RepID=UPI003B5A47C5